uniref:Uncharacterized protein n=1 Tax=Vespula pensylvanica TaxID=30213 RepID=A0A834P2T8_VESPE|nr:hypothetical protein H0235_008203 [Vespula pensylvanica]
MGADETSTSRERGDAPLLKTRLKKTPGEIRNLFLRDRLTVLRDFASLLATTRDQTANEFQRKLVGGGRGATRSNGADKKVGDSNVPVVDRYFRSSLP